MTSLRRSAQPALAGPSAPTRRFKRSNSDPLPPAPAPHYQPVVPPQHTTKKSRHSLPSGLRPPPPPPSTHHQSRRNPRFSLPRPPTSRRSSKPVEYMSSESEGVGQEDEGWELLPRRNDASSTLSEEEIMAYSTPQNKLYPRIDQFVHNLETTLKPNTIEELSLDYHSFQSSYSSSLTKSTLLIDKTYLEDSVKRIEEQCGMYEVQCEKNYETLIKGQEELVGEEKREKQRKALELIERLQVISAQILSNRQSTKSQLAQIETETDALVTKEQDLFDKEVEKVSQKYQKFIKGEPSSTSSSSKTIRPSKSSQNGGGGRRRSRKAMTSADESESQSIEKAKERKKRRKTG
ncbi:hypothetical protein JCM5353_000392 [Sporobolomyces roseus]